MRERQQLPVLGQPPPERADAARNRQKIVDCAARMIAERGAEQLSLDEVAREACVGVGTVYRRFGDRAGLIYALIDERERHFQAAFLSGPSPLGPGGTPGERISAFLRALVDHFFGQEELFLLLEKSSPKARFAGPYHVYHAHLTALLAQLRPGADQRFLADVLLAPVNVGLLNFQRTERGFTVEQIKDGLDALVREIAR
ncbi:TetR/AcrR family transcriptional regulator [Nonomuraea endophytica]|uniref:AcrR family transcriptional regulator n=1 Tax=Nonomuraea endophytica TaxID=714136 RepID=A0A7W8A7C0_9ACTN|nr:TetR/AcrR family transcriptional regulator [Nonomuraea endophytica]MBB5080893.1 AcrR family transcriptional regulator [Nonomuraea endophytica]